ncbi:hypothetical protein PVAND_005459 [Polypedilum vanderplanki]|uniref:Uncharacterized protein n=1 Tax=Polypedilum vanderplanki TaxID=319348 RepID=A0A9J6C087_POLVA|nr:hypothetical protein PVAND_005459 [Polypedilum vanderplanki]
MRYLIVILYICVLLLYLNEADIQCTKAYSIICYIQGQSISPTNPFIIVNSNQTKASSVIIFDGQMPIMPNTIFLNNPQISTISINSMNLQQIAPDNFANGGNLKSIIIMKGMIKTLGNGTFKSCTNLLQLQITEQQISFIDINTFLGLQNLQILVLNNNQISSLHPLLFNPLISLSVILLQNNSLNSLDSTLFVKNTMLSGIYFAGNSITDLSNDLFKNQNFKSGSIDFSYNYLTTAQSYGASTINFSFNKLKTFYLSSGESTINIRNNFLRKIICPNSIPTVKRLYLSNNSLSNFLCIRDMVNLTELDVSENKYLIKPTKNTFMKLTKLMILTMCNMTKFTSIPAKAFVSTQNSLYNLRVDSLSSYKIVKQLLPQLTVLAINTLNKNCTYLQSLKTLLKNQSISMNYCAIEDRNRCN